MAKVVIKSKRDVLLKGSDLTRIQEHLDVAPIKVSGLKVEFEVAGARNLALEKRIENLIDEQIDELEKEVLGSFEMCIAALQANPAKADDFARKYETLIESVLRSAERAIREDVKDLLGKLEKAKQLKLESDISVALKFIFTGIKVVKSVVLIVASHGAKVDEWLSLAKSVFDLGKQVYEALKDEATRLEELRSAVANLRKAQGVARKEAKKKAEEARKKYRDQVTKANNLLDEIGRKAGEMQGKMKAATNLKDGVAAGAKLMVLKRQITAGLGEQVAKEKRLEIIAKSLEALGVEVDDDTWLERIRKFDIDTLKETYETGKEIYEAAKDIKEIVETIAEMAH